MRSLKTGFILLLTLLWAVASNHCKLEQIRGLAFLACCDHDEAAPHQDDDCQKDSCSTVESQLYKAARTINTAPEPPVPCTLFILPPLAELPSHQLAAAGLPDDAPSNLPRLWQFSHRTALPPRAPSIDS